MTAESASGHAVTITQIEGFRFVIDFGDAFPDLVSDEPAPIGGGSGPSPEQLLIAGVSNCLCASLAFALGKYRQPGGGVAARASGRLVRNAENRLRLGGIDVAIRLGASAEALPRIDQVLAQFERFCTVSESVKAGIPVNVAVTDGQGRRLRRGDATTREDATMTETDREGAREPGDLARLFVARANAGDVEGLVALYEPDAVVAAGDVKARGHAEIRRFYADLLARKSDFPEVDALPAIVNGPLALTFARLPNGGLSVEAARRQADGSWRWTIDQLKVRPADRTE